MPDIGLHDQTIRTPRFEGHYYNCKKYGHRAFECRTKPVWTPNQPAKTKSHGHYYNWDYNTRQSCHVKNMDIFLRTTLEHTLVETTIGG